MDKSRIDALTAAFFSIFTNANGQAPGWDAVYASCLPQILIIKKTRLEQEVYNLASFIEPRKKMLSDGTLTEFEEWETSEKTMISGHIAQRFSTYRKKGFLNGQPFEQSGNKMFQFVKTADGWRIAAVIWEDAPVND